jgi:hypothetical protein
MKPWEQKIVPAGLAIAGVVFVIAAVRPALSDATLNVTFLLVGIVATVLAVVTWRRSHGPSGP